MLPIDLMSWISKLIPINQWLANYPMQYALHEATSSGSDSGKGERVVRAIVSVTN